MFKFAAILLLFLVGHFDSTAGLDEATWLEFNCKESQFDGLWRNNLRRLLVYNQRLYFLFEVGKVHWTHLVDTDDCTIFGRVSDIRMHDLRTSL